MNKFKTWAYKAATFSIHKDKMDKALLDCRKRCNENIGSGDIAEKQVQGCQILFKRLPGRALEGPQGRLQGSGIVSAAQEV